MPDGSSTLMLSLHTAIADIPAAEWDACAGSDNPFVGHAFQSALEDSGSAGARTGWLPQHAALRNEAGVLGVSPDLTQRFSAVDRSRADGIRRGGRKSGGRPDLAQSGGPDGTGRSGA